MALFYGWGSTALRLEPLQGGSLLFTTRTATWAVKKKKYWTKWQKFRKKNTELKRKKEKERAVRKKKSLERAYFLQELIFLFQTEPRAKYTKLPVVSKQVYVGKVDEEHQKSFKAIANHVGTYY